MDKYRRVPQPKDSTPVTEGGIRVTAVGSVTAYVAYAAKLFDEMGKPEVVIHAAGTALTNAVTSAEVIKRRFKGLHQVTALSGVEIVDVYEPLEEGLDRVTETRTVPHLVITLSKDPLDTSDVGYQAPLDESLVTGCDPGTPGRDRRSRRGGAARGRGKGEEAGTAKAKGKQTGAPVGMGETGKATDKGKGNAAKVPEPAPKAIGRRRKAIGEATPYEEGPAPRARGRGKKAAGKATHDEEEPPKGNGRKGKRKASDEVPPKGHGKGKGSDSGKAKSKGKGKAEAGPPIGTGETGKATGKRRGNAVKEPELAPAAKGKGKGPVGKATPYEEESTPKATSRSKKSASKVTPVEEPPKGNGRKGKRKASDEVPPKVYGKGKGSDIGTAKASGKGRPVYEEAGKAKGKGKWQAEAGPPIGTGETAKATVKGKSQAIKEPELAPMAKGRGRRDVGKATPYEEEPAPKATSSGKKAVGKATHHEEPPTGNGRKGKRKASDEVPPRGYGKGKGDDSSKAKASGKGRPVYEEAGTAKVEGEGKAGVGPPIGTGETGKATGKGKGKTVKEPELAPKAKDRGKWAVGQTTLYQEEPPEGKGKQGRGKPYEEESSKGNKEGKGKSNDSKTSGKGRPVYQEEYFYEPRAVRKGKGKSGKVAGTGNVKATPHYDDEDDYYEVPPARKGKGKGSSNGGKQSDYYEEPPPARKGKARGISKGGKQSDYYEEPVPVRKGKARGSRTGGKQSDYYEEPPPVRKGKARGSSTGGKQSDYYEEATPARKGKARGSSTGGKQSDYYEEAPPVGKGKVKGSSKGGKQNDYYEEPPPLRKGKARGSSTGGTQSDYYEDPPKGESKVTVGRKGGGGYYYASDDYYNPPKGGKDKGLRPLGEYGFLTEFNISTDEARDRVRKMVRLFGVLEFQLYDTMYSYSGPPTDDEDEWKTPCGGKLVKRSVLEAYTNEISALGGRSWLYVQAMGTDPNDQAAQEGFHVEGTHNCGDVPLLDTVFPSAEWAQRIAPKWMTFASKMGFGGIHWDTLGPGGDVPAFLRAARPLVESEGLEQTCNFVGGQAWDDSLVHENIVTFPYWEVWTVPDTLNRFWESSKNWNGGVLACYPGETADHEHEMNNRLYGGVPPLDLLIDRWATARNLSMAYLAIGDGVRRVGMEFLPAAIPMPEEEIAKIQKALFRTGEVQFLRAQAQAGSVEALTKGAPTAAPVHVEIVAQG